MIIFPDEVPANRWEFMDYCEHFLGAPYVWGGNGPYFDCSGYVCAMLRPFGRIDTKDYNAATLFKMFPEGEIKTGNLVFYGEKHIHHVQIIVDKYVTIGAEHGGRDTTLDNCWKKGAFVQYRRFGELTDVAGIRDPWRDKDA